MAIQTLTDPDAFEDLLSRSRDRPIWVFKHSLTCPTSARAFREYRQYVDHLEGGDDSPETYLLEVQNARPLSNEIAERTGIRHESPQAILLRGGEPVWNASHGRITVESLAGAVEA